MKFLDAVWRFSRAKGMGAKEWPPVPPVSNTDGEPLCTDVDRISTDAGPLGIGERPVLTGTIVWNLHSRSGEWSYDDGIALVPPDSLHQIDPALGRWFPGGAEDHARELYSALVAWGYVNREVLYPELVELYKVMCYRLRWEPGPWIKVGAALRRIAKCGKTYRALKFTDGVSRRLRAYQIPRQLPANIVNPYRAALAEVRNVA